MKFIKEIYKNLKDFIGKYVFWFSLTIGIILLLVGYNSWFFDNPNYLEVAKVAGNAVLSGGVFLAIAKSVQFTGIYSSELRKIIYSEEHLDQRKDILNIWKSASRALYKKKFPTISEDIEKVVSNEYFPTSQDFYYKDFNYTIDIDLDSEDSNYIKLEERVKTEIFTNSDESVEYRFKSTINIPSDEKNQYTTYQLESLIVNDEKIECENHLTVKRNVNNLILEFKIQLTGAKRYTIKKKESKRYSMIANPTKGHTAVSIYKNYHLELDFPKELNVDFYKSGTTNNFAPQKRERGSHVNIRQEYKGIIFPKQGFRLMFSKA